MPGSLRVLIVEDCPDDAELMLGVLRKEGFQPSGLRVETFEELATALEAEPWDAVLADFGLPGFEAADALTRVRQTDPDVPFIVVSGLIREEQAVEMMRAGASDYIFKWNLARLVPAIEREVREAKNRRARREVEQTAFRLAAIVESSEDSMVSIDRDGNVLTWNAGAERLYGYSAAEMVGRPFAVVVPLELREELAGLLEKVERGMPLSAFETVRIRKDGRPFHSSLTLAAIRDTGAKVIGFCGVSRDITAQKRLEAERDELLARLQMQIERMPLAYLLSGADLRYVRWNPAAERIFGFTEAEVLGKHPFDVIVPPQSQAFVATIFARLAAGEMNAHGISDNITKDGRTITCEWHNTPLMAADGTFLGLLSLAQDVTARREAEKAFHLRDRAVRAATQGILITDSSAIDNPIVYASPGFGTVTGYTAEEVLGRNCRFLQGKGTDPEAVARLREAIHQIQPCTVELLNYRKDGTPFWNELSLSPVRDTVGLLTHFVGVQTDVTERRKLQEQYHQSQKMEAIGQLAGGVAHDFNNFLTIINGYCELLLHDLRPDDPSRPFLDEIRKAGERSASLTRQLLAYSRKQMVAPQILDLNEVVTGTEKMLRRLIGEDIRLTTALDPLLDRFRGDPGQVEQILLNLAVNARDAMPQGGCLTIETKNVDLDEHYAREHPEVQAGAHILLAVSDTGTGMPAELLPRIFEPFFTTKGPGKGTGLGLATVYGIVKQAEGHLAVYSEVAVGTTFKIYWRRVDPHSRPVRSLADIHTAPRGIETVLLVEDEEAVRTLAQHILVGCGYTVVEAEDGDEALLVLKRQTGPIHLLVTDVIMPGSGGRKLAEQVRALHPEAKVLFMSGYTDDAVVLHGVLHEKVEFIQKPFSPVALAMKVREVLDSSG